MTSEMKNGIITRANNKSKRRYYSLRFCYPNLEKKADIVVRDYKRKTCLLIKLAVRADNNISVKNIIR